jgi:hypothetical protein
MEYAINIKRCFLAIWNKGARALGCFYGALDSSPKDLTISDHPRLTVQL